MSKSKIHIATWKVFGNRKANRVFTACLPAQQASKGDRVRLESKAGVVTNGTLTELHSAADGLEFWTIEREAKSAEEHAADRALRAEAQAEYWASDRGAETARKIRERAERKAAERGETSETSEAPAKSKPASQPAAVSPFAAKVAELLAAGVDAKTAAQVAQTLGLSDSQPASQPAKSKPAKSESKPASKPKSTGDHGDCQACKRTDQPLSVHPHGALVCNYCKSADVDTIARRVARKAASK